MFIIFWKSFTATATGEVTKRVICEKCRTPYRYRLLRICQGQGNAIYYLFQTAAENRAHASAQRQLKKSLERETEPVPCPKCHWLNQELVEGFRRRHYKRLTWILGIAAFLLLVATPLIVLGLSESLGKTSSVPATVGWTLFIFCLLSPFWIGFILRTLRSGIDPNANYPRRPTIPVGTPPALREIQDTRTGEIHLDPVEYEDEQPFDQTRQWAIFRVAQFKFPETCCICLNPAYMIYDPPLKVSKDHEELPVGLCDECASALRKRWWLWFFALLIGVPAALMLIAMVIPFPDNTGRLIMTCTISIIALPFCLFLIPSRICRPYRFKWVDSHRGVMRFSARNPVYTQMLADLAKLAEKTQQQKVSGQVKLPLHLLQPSKWPK